MNSNIEIAKKLEEAKKEKEEAKKALENEKVGKIEIGKDYDGIYDKYAVAEPIKRAFPSMNFHWISREKMSSAMSKRYTVTHIPDTKDCKEILQLAKSQQGTRLTDAYGKDVLVNGDNILMMCPKLVYDRRKQKLADDRKARTKALDTKAKDVKAELGKDIKSASISVS